MKKILALIMFLALSLSVFAACNTSPAEKTARENAQIELAEAADYLYQLYKDDLVTAVDYELLPQIAIEGVIYPITWSVELAEADAGKVVLDTTGEKPRIDIDTFTETTVEYVLTAHFSLELQVGDKTIVETYDKSFNRTLPAFKWTSFEEYIAADNGTNLFVKGYVTGIISKSVNATNNCVYIDDLSGNGGYYVYGLAEDYASTLSIGDMVYANGDKDLYNGTHELKSATIVKLDDPAVSVVARDFTEVYANATALNDAALNAPQAKLVKICGVTITSQGDNGYYHFKLGELESYLRISSSTNALSKAETEAFKALHTQSYGMLADVEGVISIYSGNFYLVPVSANAISNVRMPERSDAEKVAFELESLDLGLGEEIAKNTTVALPAAGVLYDTVAITWTLDGEAVSGSVSFELGAEAVSHVLVGTLALGETTQTVTYEFTVAAKSEDLPAGVAFVMGLNQVKAGKVVYVTGEDDGRYLKSTENIAEAAAVYAEAAEGGYKFYILDGETKLYLDVYTNSSSKDAARFAAEGDNVFAYNAKLNAWVTTHNNADKYIGAYNTYTTLGVSNLSYITVENTGVDQFPAFFEVNETVAYNIGLNQVKASKVVYVTGEDDGRYLKSTENSAEGAKVYFEKADGGYKFYMLDGETKLYLDVYTNSSSKDAARFAAEGDNVFAYKADVNAWVTTHNGADKYIGAYNTYTTLGVSNLSYITAENTGVDQFPMYFVVASNEAPVVCEHAETTETVVPSTCLVKGSKTVTCNACGETVSSEELPLADHTMAPATCLLPSTCSVEGCGHIEGEALGHNYNAEGVCANGCGIAQEHVHSWSDATCTAPKSCSCGATEGEALGHTMDDATCEAPSTCSVCGHTEGAALGHKYGAWVPGESDTHVSVCATCSESVSKATGELLAELYSLAQGASYPVKVTLTGKITLINTPYSEQYKNIEVTILVGNHTDYPMLCYRMKGDGADVITLGDTITVTGIVKNYNGKIEFDTGCTLDSYVKHDCVYGEGVVTEPSCTADGYTKYTCTICYATKTDSKVPATGHNYVGGVCGTCGHTEGAVITYDNLVLKFSSSTQTAVSSYTGSFTATIGSAKWKISSFNNNNNQWTYIKAGSKNGATTASIETTTAIAGKVVSITITTTACNPSQVSSAKLLVSTSSDFSTSTEYPVTLKSGSGTITIDIPEAAAVANAYYKLVFACAKTSSNGTAIQISQVDYKYIVA